MEIERKWLAEKAGIPYELDKLEHHYFEQRYISCDPTVRIRNIDNSRFILTIKTKSSYNDGNIARNEVEIDLKESDYKALSDISTGRTIKKTRYIHPVDNDLVEEIDVFHGDLDGLCYVEIEFRDIDEAKRYPSPAWIKKEVTDDRRYTNASLSEGNHSLKELTE